MQSGYNYDTHKVIEAQQFRHRERDISHRPALKGAARTDGILSRIVTGLKGLRHVAPPQRSIIFDRHVLTDKVCRLADGSMGRVALRESEGGWVEVCVLA